MSPVASTATAGANVDELDLRLRLVHLFFSRIFGETPAGVWYAPAPVLLLGGRPGGPALVVPSRWGVRVAASPWPQDILYAATINRLTDPIFLDLDYTGESGLPEWAAHIPAVVRPLRAGGHVTTGCMVMTYMDLPEQSGIAAGAALRSALALALTAAAPEAPPHAELATALVDGGEPAWAVAASLYGREGYATLVRERALSTGDEELPTAPFSPASQAMRLVLIALRGSEAAAPTGERPARAPGDGLPFGDGALTNPDEDARAEEGFALLDGTESLGRRLGALLRASQHGAAARRDPWDADVAAQAAVSGGAFGARATSPTTALALVPTPALRAVRSSVVAAVTEAGGKVPRLLSTGFPGPGARSHRDGLDGL